MRFQLTRSGLDLPDAFTVIAEGAVRRKFSHPRGVENGRTCPFLRLPPERTHSLLCIDVSLVIREQKKWIVVEEVLHNWTEQLTVAAHKRATGDEVYYLA